MASAQAIRLPCSGPQNFFALREGSRQLAKLLESYPKVMQQSSSIEIAFRSSFFLLWTSDTTQAPSNQICAQVLIRRKRACVEASLTCYNMERGLPARVRLT